MKDEVERLEHLKELLRSAETKTDIEENTSEEKGYAKVLLPKGVSTNEEVIEPIPNNYNKAFVNILSLSLISFIMEALFLIIAYFVFK